jgi:hypothetical protein
MGSQATKPPGPYAIGILCGYVASVGLPDRERVLKGATKRSACTSRSTGSLPSNRSTMLSGKSSFMSGGMNRVAADFQNVVVGNFCRHHVRQRCTVLPGTPSSSLKRWPDILLGGEANISITATYMRRPAKRTDCEVARASHRPQVKLKRREYSS